MDILIAVVAIGVYGWLAYREGHQRGFEEGVEIGREFRIRVAMQSSDRDVVLDMLKWRVDSNVMTDNREN